MVKTRNIFLSVLCALACTACALEEKSQRSCSGDHKSEGSTVVRLLCQDQIQGVEVGMHRSDVIEKIGTPHSSTIPDLLGEQITGCDSYLYNSQIDASFHHIHYFDGKILNISSNNKAVCSIE